MSKINFASDNYTRVHPQIMEALYDANHGMAPAYGDDTYTFQAKEAFKNYFGETARPFFVFTGTAANVLSLQTILKPFQAVICAETAHINTNECGATENFTGSKILSVKTGNGKLTPALVEPLLVHKNSRHFVQPRVLSLTQPTELGTVYSLSELKELIHFAHENDLLVHMDGARLANAAVALNCSLKEITEDVGVDVLSFGGTKNGLMMGEAIVFFDRGQFPYINDFPHIQQQGMQLASKMRYIALQFIELLHSNLWFNNAQHANAMAALLAKELERFDEIDSAYPVQTNVVFARVDKRIIQELQKDFAFYIWDIMPGESVSEVRWMTTFDTTQKEVERFVWSIERALAL